MTCITGRCKQRQTHTNADMPTILPPSSDPLSFPPLTVLDLEETLAHIYAIYFDFGRKFEDVE